MSDINELNKKLKEAIQEPLQEMSLAFVDERIHRNIWVENPTSFNDKYFKYGDRESYHKETKNCRISLLAPNYLYHSNRGNVKDWALTDADKRQLVDILNSKSDEHPEITVWQHLLFTYNQDRFGMRFTIFVEDKWLEKDYPNALRITTEMPDYTKLNFNYSKAKNGVARR